MKLFIIALFALALTGCVDQNIKPSDSTEKRLSLTQSISLLKTKGCKALPALERRLLVLFLSTQAPGYPDNGICDPNWVEAELIKQIYKLSIKND